MGGYLGKYDAKADIDAIIPSGKKVSYVKVNGCTAWDNGDQLGIATCFGYSDTNCLIRVNANQNKSYKVYLLVYCM